MACWCSLGNGTDVGKVLGRGMKGGANVTEKWPEACVSQSGGIPNGRESTAAAGRVLSDVKTSDRRSGSKRFSRRELVPRAIDLVPNPLSTARRAQARNASGGNL